MHHIRNKPLVTYSLGIPVRKWSKGIQVQAQKLLALLALGVYICAYAALIISRLRILLGSTYTGSQNYQVQLVQAHILLECWHSGGYQEDEAIQ